VNDSLDLVAIRYIGNDSECATAAFLRDFFQLVFSARDEND
jgi:hypothetical protein